MTFMGMCPPSKNLHSQVQRLYVHPQVELFWAKTQEETAAQLRGKKLVVAGKFYDFTNHILYTFEINLKHFSLFKSIIAMKFEC